MNRKIKAFTLVELIVVLVLIGIVMQIGYSMLLYGNNTFNLSTSRGLSQQNVRLAEMILSDELKHVRDVSISEDGFVTEYYSLKYESGALIKSHHVFNEATNVVDVTIVSSIPGDWDALSIKNIEPGEFDIIISQGEAVGNRTSKFELPLKVFAINNSTLLSGLDVDLTSSGTVIYYQQMYDYISQQASAMSVDIKDITEVTTEPSTSPSTEPSTNPTTEAPTISINSHAYLKYKKGNENITVLSGSTMHNIGNGNQAITFEVSGGNLSTSSPKVLIDSVEFTSGVTLTNDKITVSFSKNFNNNTDYVINVQIESAFFTTQLYKFSITTK